MTMPMIRPALGLLMACAALPAAAQAPAAVTCAGPFAKDANEAAVIAAFGKANVTREEIDVGEGSTEPGTVIFAKDPKRRIEVLWHDTKARKRPSSIILSDGATAWTVPMTDGVSLKVGATLSDAEQANGKPFAINGFGWDGGGYAANWNGGRLAKPAGGCAISLRFGPDPKANGRALDRVSGDKSFRSSDAGMRAVKPYVQQISLGWAE